VPTAEFVSGVYKSQKGPIPNVGLLSFIYLFSNVPDEDIVSFVTLDFLPFIKHRTIPVGEFARLLCDIQAHLSGERDRPANFVVGSRVLINNNGR